jgi:hypothetical protein
LFATDGTRLSSAEIRNQPRFTALDLGPQLFSAKKLKASFAFTGHRLPHHTLLLLLL